LYLMKWSCKRAKGFFTLLAQALHNKFDSWMLNGTTFRVKQLNRQLEGIYGKECRRLYLFLLLEDLPFMPSTHRCHLLCDVQP
jgi:hypothetical protein